MNTLNNSYTKTVVAILGLMLTTLSHAIDYTYDELHRLIKVSYASGQTIHYTYDAGGNILSALESGSPPLPTDNTPTNDTPVDDTSNNTPIENPPTNDTPVDDTSNNTPIENPPTNDTPVDDTSNNTPIENPPTNDTPVDDTSNNTPIENPPTNDTPTENPPTNDTPVNDNPTVTVALNQSRYTDGDNFQFNIALNGQKTVDLYAAIILPEGYFITITEPQIISAANAIAPWQQNIGINGQQSFRIFNYQIQRYLSRGIYTACGVLVSAQETPLLNGSNWLHSDCREFELFLYFHFTAKIK